MCVFKIERSQPLIERVQTQSPPKRQKCGKSLTETEMFEISKERGSVRVTRTSQIKTRRANPSDLFLTFDTRFSESHLRIFSIETSPRQQAWSELVPKYPIAHLKPHLAAQTKKRRLTADYRETETIFKCARNADSYRFQIILLMLCGLTWVVLLGGSPAAIITVAGIISLKFFGLCKHAPNAEPRHSIIPVRTKRDMFLSSASRFMALDCAGRFHGI